MPKNIFIYLDSGLFNYSCLLNILYLSCSYCTVSQRSCHWVGSDNTDIYIWETLRGNSGAIPFHRMHHIMTSSIIWMDRPKPIWNAKKFTIFNWTTHLALWSPPSPIDFIVMHYGIEKGAIAPRVTSLFWLGYKEWVYQISYVNSAAVRSDSTQWQDLWDDWYSNCSLLCLSLTMACLIVLDIIGAVSSRSTGHGIGVLILDYLSDWKLYPTW